MNDTITKGIDTLRKSDFWTPQFVVAYTIIICFFLAYLNNPKDETMKGALIAAFSGAWGWWLGSSKGSQDNTRRADVAQELQGKALDLAQANAPIPPAPDIQLEPGQSATVQAAPDDTNQLPK
jgi:hypothetical protein